MTAAKSSRHKKRPSRQKKNNNGQKTNTPKRKLNAQSKVSTQNKLKPTNPKISAGIYKSRILLTPPNNTITRPTSGRAKESLFSHLNTKYPNIVSGHVVDLFAGSGALGFEALSRGAKSCLFCEQDSVAIRTIMMNVLLLKIGNMARIHCNNIMLSPLPALDTTAHLIFADPPYQFQDYCELLQRIKASNWLNKDTIIVLQDDPKKPFNYTIPDWANIRSTKTIARARFHCIQIA